VYLRQGDSTRMGAKLSESVSTKGLFLSGREGREKWVRRKRGETAQEGYALDQFVLWKKIENNLTGTMLVPWGAEWPIIKSRAPTRGV